MKKSIISVLAVVLVLTLVVGVAVACEQPATYTVTFKNGETTVSTVEVEQGKAITAEQIPNDPTPVQGKTFVGWYVGETKVTAGYTPTENVTAVAKFDDVSAETYTVTFKNGETTVKTVEVEQGRELTAAQIPSDPTPPQGQTFAGWYVGETKVTAGYTPTENVTAVAKFTNVAPVEDITGSGTKDDPYVINTAKGLVTFAYNVNHPDVTETADWYTSYFKLGADIDMEGVAYNPAGSRSVQLAGESKPTVHGFQGSFDGDGHTISNLTIKQAVRSEAYLGLFGFTNNAAYIHDFNLVGMSITAISNANTSEIRAYIGAVAGYLGMSQVDCIHAEVTVNLQWFEQNAVLVGGIAGMFHSDGGYISYAENVSAEVNVALQEFDEGSDVSKVGSSSYVGGLFGEAYVAMNSALAIVNSSATGALNCGKALGGLIGEAYGDNLSVINCYADTSLKPSVEESVAGGIVGVIGGDTIFVDSYAKTTVVATDCTVGGIVGEGEQDSYDIYFIPGTAVSNCYYNLTAAGLTPDTTYGTATTAELTKQFATETLKWDEEIWNFDGGKILPTSKRARDINEGEYTITFVDGDNSTSQNFGGEYSYDIVNVLDEAENTDNNVFWDWQTQDGVGYRWYMPVVKNFTLTAFRYDVSDLLGTYDGLSSRATHYGVIVLEEKGVMQFITSGSGTSTWGTWCFDGEHFLAETPSDDFCGTITVQGGKHVIEWVWSEASYEITYTFTETDPTLELVGEYYSQDGDIITFCGPSQISLLLDALLEVSGGPIDAEYTRAGDVLTLTGLDSYFTSATITVKENGFETNFTAKFDDDGYALYPANNKQFTKSTGSKYADFAFLGENNSLYLHNDGIIESRKIVFKEDGTLTYGSYEGRYFVFDHSVKLIIQTKVSTFTYNEELGILYGIINMGTTARPVTVITPASEGELRGYVIDGDIHHAVFVTDNNKYYLKNSQLQTATLAGEFADGEIVTIDDVKYLVTDSDNIDGEHVRTLSKVNAEYGQYTLDGKTFTLDGVSKVSGEITGDYIVNGNRVVVWSVQDSLLFVFDYTDAQAADGVVSKEEGDGYQGIWFSDKNDSPRYYVLLIDGFGKTIVLYNKDNGVYSGNWGTEWGTYSIADGVVSAIFNSYQQATLSFYYDKQVVVLDGSTLGGQVFCANGYDGPLTAPTFNASLAGKYTAEGVELEIKTDLNVTYNGKTAKAHVVDNNKIAFTIDSVEYVFDGDALTLSFSGKTVKAEPVVVTFDIVGTWTGTLSSTVYYNDSAVEVTFGADNSVSLKIGSFDALTGTYSWNSDTKALTVSGIDGEYLSDGDMSQITEVKFVVADTVQITIELDYDYMTPYTMTATLTKQGGSAEPESPVVGTWSGTVTQKGGIGSTLTGKTITVELTADGNITITLDEGMVYSGTYTFENGKIEATVSGAYTVEELTLELQDDTLNFHLKLYDEYDSMVRIEYSADLTK